MTPPTIKAAIEHLEEIFKPRSDVERLRGHVGMCRAILEKVAALNIECVKGYGFAPQCDSFECYPCEVMHGVEAVLEELGSPSPEPTKEPSTDTKEKPE
jgi:hypothetical protein